MSVLQKTEDQGRSDEDYIAEWCELFRTSVRLRLMADVPLGMFLSGGIDSSAIAAVMSGMVDEPIKTFSVAFAEREANELEYARIVAEAFKTNHHEVVVSPEEFFNALPKLVWHEDEPLAHPSSVALYFVSLLASQHVKVVLTGEGSDELLAGYGRYRKTILNLSLGKRYRQLDAGVVRGAVRSGIKGSARRPRVRQKLLRSFLASRLILRASTSTTSRSFRWRCRAICFQTRRWSELAGSIRTPVCAQCWKKLTQSRCSIDCFMPTSRPTCTSC